MLSFLNKKYFFLLIVFILLIPTYFVNNKFTHDWGDDFAQYLYQAKHIKNETLPYKKVLNIDEFGSNKRSALFSKILSLLPESVEIKPYLDFIFFFFLLSSVAVFLFFSNHFNPLLSLLLTLGVYLNYHVIQLKEVVMTEFVFMLILFTIFGGMEKSKSKTNSFILPLLFGLLTAIRSIGSIFFISWLICLFIDKESTLKAKIFEALKSILLFSFVIVCSNSLILPEIKNSEVSFYSVIFSTGTTLHSITENSYQYYIHFQLLFEQEVPRWANHLIFISLILLVITGMVVRIRTHFGFKEISFIFYTLLLLVYPYHSACIRFLIPILPLLLYYLAVGLIHIFSIKYFEKKYAMVITSIYLSLLILSNTKTVWIDLHQQKNLYGPYRSDIIADFQRITQETKPTESIAFYKPFIINLLCERNSYYSNEKNFKRVNAQADYYLLVKNEKLDEIYFPELNKKMEGKDTIELTNFLLIKTK